MGTKQRNGRTRRHIGHGRYVLMTLALIMGASIEAFKHKPGGEHAKRDQRHRFSDAERWLPTGLGR